MLHFLKYFFSFFQVGKYREKFVKVCFLGNLVPICLQFDDFSVKYCKQKIVKVCLHFVDLALIRLQFEDFFSSNFRRKKSWNLIYILFRHNRLQTIWRIFSTKILILQTCWAIRYMMTHFCLDLKCTRKDARTIHERQKCFILLWLPIRIFVGMSLNDLKKFQTLCSVWP